MTVNLLNHPSFGAKNKKPAVIFLNRTADNSAVTENDSKLSKTDTARSNKIQYEMDKASLLYGLYSKNTSKNTLSSLEDFKALLSDMVAMHDEIEKNKDCYQFEDVSQFKLTPDTHIYTRKVKSKLNSDIYNKPHTAMKLNHKNKMADLYQFDDGFVVMGAKQRFNGEFDCDKFCAFAKFTSGIHLDNAFKFAINMNSPFITQGVSVSPDGMSLRAKSMSLYNKDESGKMIAKTYVFPEIKYLNKSRTKFQISACYYFVSEINDDNKIKNKEFDYEYSEIRDNSTIVSKSSDLHVLVDSLNSATVYKNWNFDLNKSSLNNETSDFSGTIWFA